VEGLYWISLFELFGFNKVAFHLCSLLLLAGSAALMGVCLDRAFPGRRVCISIAVLLAFFLPPVSCLTYVMFTDNSRLSMLLFWTSVLAFQRWAQQSSPWRGLALPMILYVGSPPRDVRPFSWCRCWLGLFTGAVRSRLSDQAQRRILARLAAVALRLVI
jgi:hypothetical protein